MRDKLIINDNNNSFELFLEHVKINYQETSPRYKDNFSTKYSFPFDFYLDRDLKIKIGNFSSMNKTGLKTLYEDCWHVNDGRINKAALNIISVKGNVVKAQISTGFEVFPNWNKKLRDLPLEIVKSEYKDMTSLAKNVAREGYPSYNYNFPLIYTDLYKDDNLFKDFKGALNNTDSAGWFIKNNKNIKSNQYKNNNIVIPIPYWLHVLKTGFEDAGYSLNGDVLKDPLLLKTIIAPAKKIKLFDRPEPVEWSVGTESFKFVQQLVFKDKFLGTTIGKPKRYDYGWYNSQTEINFRGRFRIKLKIKFNYTHPSNNPFPEHLPVLYLNDRKIYEGNSKDIDKEDEIIIETPRENNKLKFRCFDYKNDRRNRIELKIIPMEIYDKWGKTKKSLADFKKVNLAENLPNQTFGHFVKTTKKLLNLDFTVKNGTEVWMNYINNIFSSKEYINLSKYEIKNPERYFQEDLVFELTYPKVENINDNNYNLFIDKNDQLSKKINPSRNKEQITFPILPLNMKFYGDDRSCSQTTESDDYYQVVLYNGTNKKNRNLTLDNYPYDIRNIYSTYWYSWLKFRISSINIKWSFLVNKNKFRRVNVLSTIFAYNQKIFIKKMTKQSYDSKTYEINIEGDIVRN